MLEELKKIVCEANLLLPQYGLVTFTWGNVSGIDREQGLVVIKPSGVDYNGMTPEDMVVVDLDGKRVEGKWKPSSDTATHVEIYKAFPALGGVIHTHSSYGYERNTGVLIVNEFIRLGLDPVAVPGCLCKNHGPFAWGKDPHDAVHNAVVMEECAKMAYRCELINPEVKPAPQELQDKHYLRKHGKNAYYGQG